MKINCVGWQLFVSQFQEFDSSEVISDCHFRIDLPENLRTFLKLEDTEISKMEILKLSAR